MLFVRVGMCVCVHVHGYACGYMCLCVLVEPEVNYLVCSLASFYLFLETGKLLEPEAC